MRIETVLGQIEPNTLGNTLFHEHLIADFSCWWTYPNEASKLSVVDEKFSLKHISQLRRNIGHIKDNYTLTDTKLAVEELRFFKIRGGNSLVELTLPGAGRDIWALKQISQETGVNVIAGTGWYVQATHPKIINEKSPEELSEIMVKELTEGIENTDIKAGIIGEIGCSSTLHDNEIKVLRAAAIAQRKTGACISIHSPGKVWKDGHKYLDIIEEEGGHLEKVVMLHMDSMSHENPPKLGLKTDYHRELLERSVTICYDAFGRYQQFDIEGNTSTTDRERIDALIELSKENYDKQIVISHDVFLKMHLKKYGGQGYDFINQYVVPALKKWGLDNSKLNNILVNNQKRLLSF